MLSTYHPMTPIDHRVTAADGRTIAVSEYGEPDGPAVLFAHRSAGSRLLDPDPDVTRAHRIRLIAIDRPGVGGTDPAGTPKRITAAEDARVVLDALGVSSVHVVGWSGGGQFALETAALLGRRALSMTLIATNAPQDDVAWLPEEMQPLLDLIRDDTAVGLAAAQAACEPYSDPSSPALQDPGAADARAREIPGVQAALRSMFVEAARQGPVGAAYDVVAGTISGPLPFDAVRCPALLVYGDADERLDPVAHSAYYSARLPGSQLTMCPGAGHLVAITHWSIVLDNLDNLDNLRS